MPRPLQQVDPNTKQLSSRIPRPGAGKAEGDKRPTLKCSRCDRSEAVLEDAKETIRAQEEELKDLTKKTEELCFALTEAQEEAAQYQEECERIHAEGQELCATYATKCKRVTQLTAQHAQLTAAIADRDDALRKTAHGHQVEVTALLTVLANELSLNENPGVASAMDTDESGAHDVLREALRDVTAERDEAHKEVASLQRELAATMQANERLQEDMGLLQRARRESAPRPKAPTVEAATATAALASVEEEAGALRERIVELEAMRGADQVSEVVAAVVEDMMNGVVVAAAEEAQLRAESEARAATQRLHLADEAHRTEVATLRQEVSRWRSSAEEMAEYRALEAEAEALGRLDGEALSDAARSCDDLKATCETLELTVADLAIDSTDVLEHLAASAGQLEALHVQLHEMETVANAASIERAAATAGAEVARLAEHVATEARVRAEAQLSAVRAENAVVEALMRGECAEADTATDLAAAHGQEAASAEAALVLASVSLSDLERAQGRAAEALAEASACRDEVAVVDEVRQLRPVPAAALAPSPLTPRASSALRAPWGATGAQGGGVGTIYGAQRDWPSRS